MKLFFTEPYLTLLGVTLKIFKKIERLPEFEKEIKSLHKRFCTIEEDLEVCINTQFKLYHKLKIDNNGIEQISGLEIENHNIYKVKKFTCRSLKGRGVQSGIRIIYAYHEEKDKIELIEIYYKGDKKNENRERILNYCKRRD